MGDKRISFRKSMSGYNKDDVNSYIEQMSIKLSDAEAEYQKKIGELENKIKELEANAGQVEELSKKLEESDNLIAKLNETVDNLNIEKNELIKENAVLQSQAKETELRAENSEVVEKSNKYDQVSGQIGELILNANAKAETIVNEAQIKARINANTIIDSAMEKLSKLNEKYVGEITSKTVQLTEELRAISLSADSFRVNTQNSLENECKEIKESIEYTKNIVLKSDEE